MTNQPRLTNFRVRICTVRCRRISIPTKAKKAEGICGKRHRWILQLNPSLVDETSRNTRFVLVLSFRWVCLIFSDFECRACHMLTICVVWIIAAFFPLPNRPSTDKEAFICAPGIEPALQARFREFEERRYENARWWRRLNRCMIPVGITVIVFVVCLAWQRVWEIGLTHIPDHYGSFGNDPRPPLTQNLWNCMCSWFDRFTKIMIEKIYLIELFTIKT